MLVDDRKGVNASTLNTFFTDEEITATAEECRDVLVQVLWKAKRSAQPYNLSVMRMVKSTPALAGVEVAADNLWRLLCGRDTQNRFIPATTVRSGQPRSGYSVTADNQIVVDELIMIRDGKWQGTATTAWYVGLPMESLQNKAETLTELSDAFYDTLMLFVARELLMKIERGSLDRIFLLEAEMKEAFLTLQ